jgi:PIN like domain
LKIRFDEHVSEKIVKSLRDLTRKPDLYISSVTSAAQKGSSDIHWMTSFTHDGGNAIITADDDFIKKSHLIVAIQETGLKVIHLPRQWANSTFTMQAAFLLLWWDRIYETLNSCNNRELHKIPWTFGPKAAMNKKILPFQKANNKVKKANRRNINN